MEDSDKTLGQNMEEEALDKLVSGESNEPVFPWDGVVPGAESYFPVCHAHQPLVGDGYPVGVAADILEDVLRSAKGLFGIDHPFLASEFSYEAAEHLWRLQVVESALKMKFAFVIGLFESFDELAPEDL